MEAITPAHGVYDIGDVQFISNFDNGNLQRVEKLENSGPYHYKIWSAYDNHGTPHQSRHCSWFHFSVTGIPAGASLVLYLVNGGHHNNLYKYDMRPVYRSASTNNKWVRLKMPVKQRRAESGDTILVFEHIVELENDKVFFAFTYPYSYANLLSDLSVLDSHVNDFNNPDSIITYREHLISTLEGRRIELITITSAEGASDAVEPPLPGLFPDVLNKDDLAKRPRVYPHKEVIFVSSRVHPGEVPAQHVWKGMFQFLLDPNDLCARALRRHYVIKMIPMLNPDGVFHGHFRMDQLGQNLNRYYSGITDPALQPSIYAAKYLLDYYSNNKSLSLYLDLHAHASKRGCFMYGNVLNDIEDQVQNQLFCKLIAINSPHFDYEGCLFNKEHMSRIDPGDKSSGLTAEGSGRVSTYLAHGLVHSYTLECNYNCSRFGNEIYATEVETGGMHNLPASPFTANPEKYSPPLYWGVGRACLIAMLDIRGQNPCSRITKSKIKTLEKLRNAVMCEVRQMKDFKAVSRRGTSTNNIGNREKSDSIDGGDAVENVVVQDKTVQKERDFVMGDMSSACGSGRSMSWRRTVNSPATSVRISHSVSSNPPPVAAKVVACRTANISPIDVMNSLSNKGNLKPALEKKVIEPTLFCNSDLKQPKKPDKVVNDTSTRRQKGLGKKLKLATDGLSFLINNTPTEVLSNAVEQSGLSKSQTGKGQDNAQMLGSISATTTHRSALGISARATYEQVKMGKSIRSGDMQGNVRNGKGDNQGVGLDKDDIMPPILGARSNSSSQVTLNEGPHHNIQNRPSSFQSSPLTLPSDQELDNKKEMLHVDSRKVVGVGPLEKSPSFSRFLPKLDNEDINRTLESLNLKKSFSKLPNNSGGESENKCQSDYDDSSNCNSEMNIIPPNNSIIKSPLVKQSEYSKASTWANSMDESCIEKTITV